MALSLNIAHADNNVLEGVVSGMDAAGRAWTVRYEGFLSSFSLWAAVNADGFYLAPGAAFAVRGRTPVVRA